MSSVTWKDSIIEETQIIHHLVLLFKDKPSLCKKVSISGVGSNQRVIVVRNQCLEYYNVPKNFRENTPIANSLLIQSQCKGRARLQDIYELTYLPENKQKKKIIQLLIPYNKLNVKNETAYKSAIKNEDKSGSKNSGNQLVHWVFEFERDLKQRLRQQLQEEAKKKEQQNQRVPIMIQNDLKEGILNLSNLSSIRKRETDRKFIDTAEQLFDPQRQLDDNVNKIRKLKERIQFSEEVKRQEEKRQEMIRNSAKLNKNLESGQQLDQYAIRGYWREFHRAYEHIIKDQSTYLNKERLEKQMNFLNEIKKFQTEAKSIIMEYIDEKLVGWKPERMRFHDFEFYKGVWVKIGDKDLNQEFLASSLISDLCLNLKAIKGLKIRVPLMVFVKYKTFKVLCMSDMPFSLNKRLIEQLYNIKKSTREIDIQILERIKGALFYLEKIVGTKNDPYIGPTFQTDAPLGYDIIVYKYDNNRDDVQSNFLQNFYYLVNIKDIFPPDYNYQKLEFAPECRIRPQLILQWRDTRQNLFIEDNQLLSKGFQHSKIPVENQEEEDMKITDICDKFLTKKAFEFVELLEKIELLIIDSLSLKIYMSEFGLNSRYLGTLYRLVTISYLKQFLMIQMLSRCIKSEWRQTIHEMIKTQQLGKRQVYLNKQESILNQQVKEHSLMMNHCAVDFLNLVFGKGKQSDEFWKIIKQCCKKKYDVDFLGKPNDLKPGCLLFSVLWHCQLTYKVKQDIPLFERHSPFHFDGSSSIYQAKVKSFQYPSLMCNRIAGEISNIKYDSQNRKEIQEILLPLLKFKLHNSFARHQYEFQTQIDISRLNLFSEELEKPIGFYQNHPIILPYYFANKTTENFKRALQIISFGLPAEHPLYVSLYDQYSDVIEPQLFKKSALLASIKGLGEFHQKTTDLYSKYFRQGYTEFQIKAARSEGIEGAYILSEQLMQKQKYETCLGLVMNRINIRKKQAVKPGKQVRLYLNILKNGINSADQIRNYHSQLIFLQEYSEFLNIYKINNLEDHHFVLENALIVRLVKVQKKYFVYKLVLLAIKIQEIYEPSIKNNKDPAGFYKPRNQAERRKILEEIMHEYYMSDTHSQWIANIFNTLQRGYLYFNHLSDLFNNYKFHLQNYGIGDFKTCLGYLDTLIRYFGQKIFYDFLYEVNAN